MCGKICQSRRMMPCHHGMGYGHATHQMTCADTMFRMKPTLAEGAEVFWETVWDPKPLLTDVLQPLVVPRPKSRAWKGSSPIFSVLPDEPNGAFEADGFVDRTFGRMECAYMFSTSMTTKHRYYSMVPPILLIIRIAEWARLKSVYTWWVISPPAVQTSKLNPFYPELSSWSAIPVICQREECKCNKCTSAFCMISHTLSLIDLRIKILQHSAFVV